MPQLVYKRPNISKLDGLAQQNRIKFIIKRAIAKVDYQKLTHFVYLDKPFKQNIPGSYSIYCMCEGGVAIATNALCINEWLACHNLPVRAPIIDSVVEKKLIANTGLDIDTRTESSVAMRNKRGRKSSIELLPRLSTEYNSPMSLRGDMELTENIWAWWSSGVGTTKLAERLNCTVPAIYYHLKKYKKNNPDWAKDLEVDNT